MVRQQFARFLDKLGQHKDVDGHSLLDNSMIVYGSGNADGNRHTHDNLPVILAGGGGGTLTPGRYVKHGSKPMTNLFLSMADRLGIQGLARFGDSTERLGQRLACRPGLAHAAWSTTMTSSRLSGRVTSACRQPTFSRMSPRSSRSGPTGAPGFESRRNEPELAKGYWVKNIHNPSITVFLPPKEKATGAAVVICPGGGHRVLVFNAEGVDPARYLNSIGVAAFALKYRLGREQGSPYSIEKHAREDGVRAMRLVRCRAKEWNVDPARVGIMGFSAGGEVASMVAYGARRRATRKRADPIDRLSSRPDFQIMIYPGPLGHSRGHPPQVTSGVPARGQRRSRRGPRDRQPVPEVSRRAGARRGAHLRPRRPRLQHGEPVETGHPQRLAAATWRTGWRTTRSLVREENKRR